MWLPCGKHFKASLLGEKKKSIISPPLVRSGPCFYCICQEKREQMIDVAKACSPIKG
jgi:hypothetical protein